MRLGWALRIFLSRHKSISRLYTHAAIWQPTHKARGQGN